jgi:serine/threonine-protein kinase
VFSPRPVGIVVEQEPLPKFSVPSGGSVNVSVSKGIEKIAVPDVTGQSLEDARAALESRGFKVGKIVEKEQAGPPGRVVSTDPVPGTVLAKGAAVSLTVISGKLTVPDLFGKTFEQARSELEAMGFSNVVRQDVPSTNPAEAGTVVGQNPARGSKADRNDTITLRVAEPAPTTPPPTTAPPTTEPPTSPPPTFP